MTYPANPLQPLNGNKPSMEENDIHWMKHAIALAKQAQTQGEVPIGAVLVKDNQLLGEGWNQPIKQQDPSAHAEIIALRQAAKKLGNYRLPDTRLYVTLDPCIMCAGAMIHARIARLIFATPDPKTGAAGSVFNILQSDKLNHRVICQNNVCAIECSTLLKQFFQKKR